jgi:bifunctional non-homologous end joining protein LigD
VRGREDETRAEIERRWQNSFEVQKSSLANSRYTLPAPCSAYVAFDLLWLNGADLRSLLLRERRRLLQSILPKGSSVISEALAVQDRGRELFELMSVYDLEGIVAKRLVCSGCGGRKAEGWHLGAPL